MDSPIRIEILNGCGVAGVAGRVRVYLRERGYDVLSTGNAKGHFEKTLIIERKSSRNSNARRLARTLKCDEQFVTRFLDSLSSVSVTLIVGDDYTNYLPDSLEAIQ